MSEYDDSKPYHDVYDYPRASTRADQDQQPHAFSGFVAAHPGYQAEYVATQAQVPSGLPQSSNPLALVPSAQEYVPHDPSAYYGQQVAANYPAAYLDAAPRTRPEITNWMPRSGPPGTKVTVYFQSVYDFDEPRIEAVIMFGEKRVSSTLRKSPTTHHNYYAYALDAEAPSMASTNLPSPVVPLSLLLDDGVVTWESPTLDLGGFTYLDSSYCQLDSPQMTTHSQMQAPRKRKLSPEASPRRSPTKKPSMQRLSSQYGTQSTDPDEQPFRRPSLPDAYQSSRRFSGVEYQQTYGASLSRVQSQQQYYGQPTQTTPSMQTAQSPSWSYAHGQSHISARSPSAPAMSTTSRSSTLMPSPGGSSAPPLIRTSTIQQSPTSQGAMLATPTVAFNPYAMYPANAKAILKIDGDLNTMSEKWTKDECDAKRRLVQFRRSQSGSVISATFEPVTLEDRIPNSICVSCIWWAERGECYVTSVDTISLLESLVAVRFTVEEKNRIRRNLEGFRPATVSKTKAESEEFFKLIMGFPNPKPRNIEKDVKVFPWRILATALKKIIGKYSASYSSTAGALHTPTASYASSRPSDATGIDQRQQQRTGVSPRSSTSSAASHGHVYAAPPPITAMPVNVYASHAAGTAGLGLGPSVGQPDMRLSLPTTTGAPTTSWHQPSSHYSTDLAGGRTWDWSGYAGASPATGLPGTAQSYPYQQRVPALTGPTIISSTDARFVPLHDYDTSHSSQPTTSS